MRSLFHTFLTVATNLGDSACLMAVVGAACMYLLTRRSRRAAVFLLTSFMLSAGCIALLKLAFLGCRTHFHAHEIHSPSGHAAMSAGVFWGVAILMRTQLSAPRRFLPLFLATLLIGVIAVSRVRLEFHNSEEVIVGLLTGFISVMLARFFVLRHRGLVPFDAYALALWCVIALVVLHGAHLPGEEWIRALAGHMHRHVPFCGVI